MRGSPFFRTLWLVGGLMLAGLGMLRFRGAPASMNSGADVARRPVAPGETHRHGFALKLSEPALAVELKGRDGAILFHGGASDPLTGTLVLDRKDPVVFVTVRWKAPPVAGGNHFVKLTLEPPGKPSVVRYFEAPGDLEDVWELPLAKE